MKNRIIAIVLSFAVLSGVNAWADETTVNEIKNYEFYGSDLESYEIPDMVEEVGIYAFSKSESLKSISLGNIPYISSGMFYDCTSLEDVIIPESVKEIRNHAFAGCISLKEMEIPESVTKLGINAFYNCKALESVKVDGEVSEIPESLFEGCDLLSSMELPIGVTTIKERAFKDCLSLYNVVLPEGVLSIEDEAFSGCSKLLNIRIPETVDYISDSAFSGCQSKLNIVAIKDSYAENYAKSHGINYTEIEVVEPEVVEKKDLTKAEMTIDETEFIFDKKSHRPKVTVLYEGELLTEGVDYSLVYTNVKKPGTHKARINGMGDFQGKKTKKYTISVVNPKNVSAVNIKKKSVRFKAKKQIKKAAITGYQIAYKIDGKKGYNRKRIKNTGNLNYVLTKLKKNKKYNLRVRCYVKYGKKYYYSDWSEIITKRIKK